MAPNTARKDARQQLDRKAKSKSQSYKKLEPTSTIENPAITAALENSRKRTRDQLDEIQSLSPPHKKSKSITTAGDSECNTLPAELRLRKGCNFLDLPGEIRNMIYEEVLVQPYTLHYLWTPKHKIWAISPPPGLLQVCRRIKNEALPIYYGKNRFHLDDRPFSALDANPPNLVYIRTFELSYSKIHNEGLMDLLRRKGARLVGAQPRMGNFWLKFSVALSEDSRDITVQLEGRAGHSPVLLSWNAPPYILVEAQKQEMNAAYAPVVEAMIKQTNKSVLDGYDLVAVGKELFKAHDKTLRRLLRKLGVAQHACYPGCYINDL